MRINRSGLCIILLSVFVASCYEKKEGCLDVFASNFALDADINCCRNNQDCCCNYPKLTLSIKHQYESENLATGKIYLTRLGQPFMTESIHFFISNVRLTDGSDFATDDTLMIVTNDGQIKARPDDVLIVNSDAFSFKVGTFNRPGNYTQLKFLVGLSEPELSAPSSQFAEGHPLASGQTTLRDTLNDEWLTYRVAWIPDTVSLVTEHLQVSAENLIEVIIPVNISKNPGQDITIPLIIEYHKWLGEIDLIRDDQATKNSKILEQLAQSFSIL